MNLAIFDVVCIRVICKHLQFHELVNLSYCCKRLKKMVRQYLAEKCYLLEYIDPQIEFLEKEMRRLSILVSQYESYMKQLGRFRSHNNIKPDGWLRWRPQKKWYYCNIENAMQYVPKRDSLSAHEKLLYVRENQAKKNLDRIVLKLRDRGYIRYFIPFRMKKEYPDIHMIYGIPKDIGNTLKKWHPCKICKNDHVIQNCPKTFCHICKRHGHLTSMCRKAKCKQCKGKHLTSRCPRNICFKCGRDGHISDRCKFK